MADPQPSNWFDRQPSIIRHALSTLVTVGLALFLTWVAGKMGVPAPVIPPPPVFDPAEVSQGWVRDDDQVAALVAALPDGEKRFADTPAGRAALGPDDDVYLWDAARSVAGDVLPARDQGQVGSCVAFGTAAAVEHLLMIQIARDRRDGRRAGEFRELATEVVYGGSRVEVGGGRIRGDGSVGAWAARWVKEWGVVPRGTHGRHDLTRYDEARCRQYGARGVPDELEPLARESPVKAVSQVRTAAEAVQALRQGYPLIVCSDQGFDMARGSDGFAAPRGTWMHCVPYGTMISTQIPKPCQDVVVGDQVVAHDGKLHTVKEVHTRHYDDDMICLKADGMVETKFTKHHPILVYRPLRAYGTKFTPGLAMEVYGGGKYAGLVDRYKEWEAGNPVWLASEEVMEGDYLLSPKLVAHSDVQMPLWSAPAAQSKNVPVWPSAPTDDLAWLFGLFIADGNADAGHRVSIVLNRTETASIDRACRAWQSLGLTPRLVEKDTYTRVIVDSAVAANSFREWFGTSSSEKHIPEFLYHGWDTRALVDGITDGDGCVACKGKGYAITTTSNRLALQVHQLLLTHGERPSMTNLPRNGGEYANAAPGWVVTWQPAGPNSRMRHWKNYYLMPVREVKRERYTGTVWNYEVEHAHSYLANNIVSHNCMAILGYTAGPRTGFWIQNSWGVAAHRGPTGKGNPPEGGFWADAAVVGRMLAQGDSWAFGDAAGFPAKAPLPIDWFAHRRPDPRKRLAFDTPFAIAP